MAQYYQLTGRRHGNVRYQVIVSTLIAGEQIASPASPFSL
jgi:hypothetical protein